MQREITIGAVIYKKNKQGIGLLMEANDDNWNIFFDQLASEDNIEQKTLRMAENRSGIKDIRLISDLGRIKYWMQRGQDLVHRRVYSFLFEMPQTSTYRPDEDQTKTLRWFEPDDGLALINSKDEKLIIQKALEKLKITPKLPG